MGNKTAERRAFAITELAVIRGSGGKGHTITGHAAVFNSLSEDLGGFREKINPGAFTKTLREADVRALLNHDSNFVLGRNKANTLTLAEDDRGLATKITPPNTTWANDLLTSMERGDINQMSFQFRTILDTWETGKADDLPIRTLQEVELYDVSVVTFPAYPATDASARAILSRAGIDWDAVTAVMMRSLNGVKLTDADRSAVNKTIEALQNVITVAPSQSAHAAAEGVLRDLDFKMRELDLMVA